MLNLKKIEVIGVLICLLVFPAFAQKDITNKKQIQENGKKGQISQSWYFNNIRSFRLDTVYKTEINYSKPANTKNLYLEPKKITNENLKKSGQTTQGSGWKRQISDFGWGFFLSYRYQWYDNEVMNYFKKVSMFSMDLDYLIRKLTITGNAAFGGGRLYDSLHTSEFDWQPQTKITTSTYGVFLAYAIKDARIVKISPFAGLQLVKIKFKPDDYMDAPDEINKSIISPVSFSLGVHCEIKANDFDDDGKPFEGGGLRISYSYSILNFPDMNGFMHQLTIGVGGCFRKVKWEKP